MDTLYIVMPAYNEEANIEAVVRAWYARLDGKDAVSKLVVADSGSTDGTHSILLSLQKELPKLEILEKTEKQHGPKVLALYSYAIAEGADFVFQTDSDGQTNPAEFHDFWQLRNRYDGIIGERRVRGDGKVRRFVEWVVCVLLKIIFRVKIDDANAPFRLMRCDMVKKYMDRLPSDFSVPNIMFSTYFMYYHENIIFKEISFASRLSGKNSINLVKIIKIGWKALGDFRHLKKEM